MIDSPLRVPNGPRESSLKRLYPSSDGQTNLFWRVLLKEVDATHGDLGLRRPALLAKEVTFWGDGGGKVPGAAMHPITGREAVAHFFLEIGSVFRRSLPLDTYAELAEVNGQSALITRVGSQVLSVLTMEVEAGHIRTIRVVANPEKLTHV